MTPYTPQLLANVIWLGRACGCVVRMVGQQSQGEMWQPHTFSPNTGQWRDHRGIRCKPASVRRFIAHRLGEFKSLDCMPIELTEEFIDTVFGEYAVLSSKRSNYPKADIMGRVRNRKGALAGGTANTSILPHT